MLPDFSAEALTELAWIAASAATDGERVRDLRHLLWASSGNARKLFPSADAIETARKACMDCSALQKLFGIGPTGTVISLILLAAAVLADRLPDHPEILKYRSLMEA